MKDFSIFDYESEHDAQSSPEVCYEVILATVNTMKIVGCTPEIISQTHRPAIAVSHMFGMHSDHVWFMMGLRKKLSIWWNGGTKQEWKKLHAEKLRKYGSNLTLDDAVVPTIINMLETEKGLVEYL